MKIRVLHDVIASLCEPDERVEITRAIRPQYCVPGEKILHRETKQIKFNRTQILTSEFEHKYNI
jgi:hypothetical protein